VLAFLEEDQHFIGFIRDFVSFGFPAWPGAVLNGQS
jgi:hypothetical protein